MLVAIVTVAFHIKLLHFLPPILLTPLYKAKDLSSMLKMHDRVRGQKYIFTFCSFSL